mmetsp:Transcript_14816/g.24124  ORF Transcript_14816/g.24124 Transcript_14816/m.24124 type:complete len:561 (-) Transcript_14816:106-1788(-)
MPARGTGMIRSRLPPYSNTEATAFPLAFFLLTLTAFASPSRNGGNTAALRAPFRGWGRVAAKHPLPVSRWQNPPLPSHRLTAKANPKSSDGEGGEGQSNSTVASANSVISLETADLDATLLSIAVPALFALASDPVASLVDTAFVGKIGPEALAATGIATSILNLASKVITTPLVSVTTTQVARAEGDEELLSAASTAALEVGLVAGIIQALLITCLAVPFAAGVTGEAIGDGLQNELVIPTSSVLRIRAIATPAVAISLAVQGMFRGVGDTRTPLAATIGCNVLNLALNAVAIFYLHTGVSGPAAATTIAEVSSMLFLLFLITRRIQLHPSFRLDALGGTVREMAGDTLILSLRSAVVWATFTIASALTARIDNDTSAAYQVCQQLWLSTALINDALAIAAQTVLAQALSKGRPEAAMETIKKIISWSIGTGVFLGTAVWLSFDEIAGLFTRDIGVQEKIQSMLPFVAVSMPFASVAFTLDGVLYGARDFQFAARTMFAASSVAIVSMIIGTLTESQSDDVFFIWGGFLGLMLTRVLVISRRLRDRNGPFSSLVKDEID